MVKKFFKYLFFLTLGSTIYAFSFAVFTAPNDLAPGGLTGIAVMLQKVIPIGTGIIVLIMNVPLMIIGTWKFGKGFLLGTVYSTVLMSVLIEVFTWAFQRFGLPFPLTSDLLLAALAGGAGTGLGIGIVFRYGGTTGGSDIMVKLLKLKFRYIKSGMLMIIIDATIVTVSAIVFGNIDLALYAALSLIVTSLVLDVVLYGNDSARLVYIISGKNELIAHRLLEELDLGATYVRGMGAYTKEDRTVLMVAVKKQIFPKLKSIVGEEDDASFMIVSSANEIFGEGFKLHNSAEL